MKSNNTVLKRVYIKLLSNPDKSQPKIYYEIEYLATIFIQKHRNKKCLKGKK